MKCRTCGNVLDDKSKECAVCGALVEAQIEENNARKEPFFNTKTQLMFVGLIAVSLLYIWLFFNLIGYGNLIDSFNNSFETLGIVGLIFSIPMFLCINGLLIFQILYIFSAKLPSLEKAFLKLPFVGFLLYAFIAFVTFVLSIWRVAIGFGAIDFFNQLLFVFGLIAIHVWLFMIAVEPPYIFPKKPQTPSQVIPKPYQERTEEEGE